MYDVRISDCVTVYWASCLIPFISGISDDNHDILEAIFEKRYAFKAFFRRLLKNIQ